MQSLPWRRLDLDEIARSLQVLGGLAAAGALEHESTDEPVTGEALTNLFEGYRYVDDLLARRAEIFGFGASRLMLELNHIVLCGSAPENRVQYAGHIAETERHFYDEPESIGAFHDWFRRNATLAPQPLAAGVFAHILSTPQLFIEGNSRTATLLAGYILARSGMPPLVVTPRWLRSYHEVVGQCSAVRRDAFAGRLSLGTAAHRAGEFLALACEPRFLAAETEPAVDTATGRLA